MLESILHDDVLELRLARPPVNAINPALTVALSEAIRGAPAREARAIVISGRSGLFSAGLDVPELLSLDHHGMTVFWDQFYSLLGAIACSSIPVVAAITGHSPAGGAVMSIFCDYRVMANGNYKIGLNEVQVGLVVPEAIQFALKRLIGIHRAERLMVAGAMIDSHQALQLGFVDELAELDQVTAQAINWCKQNLALPHNAMSETRRIARADLHEWFLDKNRMPSGEFAERWFNAETQTTLHALVAKLKAK